jgi:hypothetical protein
VSGGSAAGDRLAARRRGTHRSTDSWRRKRALVAARQDYRLARAPATCPKSCNTASGSVPAGSSVVMFCLCLRIQPTNARVCPSDAGILHHPGYRFLA